MKYCKKCTMPDTRPGITFDENVVCCACNHYENRKNVALDKCWKDLRLFVTNIEAVMALGIMIVP